jgi:uncharacterized delta-60 repeat protein
MKRILLASSLQALACFVAIAAHAQAPGDLDLTFAGTGMVHLGFGNAQDFGYGMALQDDGKVVMAGYCYNGDRREVVVARYNTDGSLDPTFDHDGRVITSVTPSYDPTYVGEDLGYAVRIQADGKIVVAGLSRSGPGGGNNFLVLRYNTNGSLDNNFGVNGHVIQDFSGGDDEAHALAIQTDGKIVVAGSVSVPGGINYGIVRYNTNGTPDASFGSGGVVSIGNLIADAAYGVTLQSDGKIVATGWSVDNLGDERVSVLRLGTTGVPDPTFDGDGWVYTQPSAQFDVGNAVTMQPDPPSAERIVVAGLSGTSMVVLRYMPNGAPDPSFDGDGRVFVANSSGGARAVAVELSGGVAQHIVVCGSISSGGVSRFGAARFNLNGTPDAGFDGDGILTTAIGTSAGAGALLLPAGKLVLGGSSGVSTDVDFTVARYSSSGVLDATFDGDGIRSDPFGNSTAIGRAVTHQADGKIVIAGNVSEAASSRQRIGVMRLLTDGTQDPTFNGKGTVTTDVGTGDDVVGGVAMQADGKIVVVGSAITPDNSNSDIVVLRYLSNGQLDPSFSGDGILTMTIMELDRAQGVVIQPDGRIVVAGWTSNYSNADIAVLRFTTNGALDPTFSGDGLQLMDLSVDDRALAVALQPNGRIVVAGESWVGDISTGHSQTFVARLTDTGVPDPTFSGDGVVQPAVGFMGDAASALAIQPDGKIVVGGWRDLPGPTSQIAMLRLDAFGVPDAGFDGDGVLFTTVGNGGNHATGVAVQSDGTLLAVCGAAEVGARPDFGVASYKSDGSLNDGFVPGGKATYDFVLGSTDGAAVLSIDALGRIVVAGFASGLFGVERLLGMQALVDAPAEVAPSRTRVAIAGANPFTGQARVAFDLIRSGKVRLDVFDVTGARVRTLANSVWPTGRHQVEWDGADTEGRTAPPGVYFVRLALDDKTSTCKAIKLR